tara:strand:+ start:1200 stop:1568 length:369 start_codon:yes stop_codon:yes gene_type:complete
MSSLSVKLPLVRDIADGFLMIKDFRTLIKQNFKMLIMTNPGERVMIPEFGVGIRSYLFENFSEVTYSRIENKIFEQTEAYMPFLKIQEMVFEPSSFNNQTLIIKIHYVIPNLNVMDLLEFTI